MNKPINLCIPVRFDLGDIVIASGEDTGRKIICHGVALTLFDFSHISSKREKIFNLFVSSKPMEGWASVFIGRKLNIVTYQFNPYYRFGEYREYNLFNTLKSLIYRYVEDDEELEIWVKTEETNE